MNVGLVKGCLKTELLSVFWRYSGLKLARPKGFFLPWFIICWSVLAKTNSTGWAVKYCMHRNKFSWISWDGLFGDSYQEGSQAGCKINWNLCILVMQGQNAEMATLNNWTCLGGHRSHLGCNALEYQALQHLPSGLTARAFVSQYLWRVSSVVRRIRHLRCEEGARPLSPAALTCPSGEAHTQTRCCFFWTEGFLVTLDHRQLFAVASTWYLDFTKSSVTGVKDDLGFVRTSRARAGRSVILRIMPEMPQTFPSVKQPWVTVWRNLMFTSTHFPCFITQPFWKPRCSLERCSYFYKGREKTKGNLTSHGKEQKNI